jgi:hypothetical protein
VHIKSGLGEYESTGIRDSGTFSFGASKRWVSTNAGAANCSANRISSRRRIKRATAGVNKIIIGEPATKSMNRVGKNVKSISVVERLANDDFINAGSSAFDTPAAADAVGGAVGGASISGHPSFGGTKAEGSTVSDAGTFVLAETALDMHCWGVNPVVTAKLQLNGQDRFSEREGTYFDLVQPYQHHTRTPDTGINVYSFALKPEEHQPSGSCNFSRIDNATLQLVLSNATAAGTNTAKVRVYATNYNVLRVMSGMGGLAYSN